MDRLQNDLITDFLLGLVLGMESMLLNSENLMKHLEKIHVTLPFLDQDDRKTRGTLNTTVSFDDSQKKLRQDSIFVVVLFAVQEFDIEEFRTKKGGVEFVRSSDHSVRLEKTSSKGQLENKKSNEAFQLSKTLWFLLTFKIISRPIVVADFAKYTAEGKDNSYIRGNESQQKSKFLRIGCKHDLLGCSLLFKDCADRGLLLGGTYGAPIRREQDWSSIQDSNWPPSTRDFMP
ncbi:hypothetical protein Tco_0859351 [Tanacetum coccineum]|uniref:Uncharacterized protein n=1 Tax=Tanacetum coccineum TaxID=301880 RepID=A0ABQ5BHG8_9ASTR